MLSNFKEKYISYLTVSNIYNQVLNLKQTDIEFANDVDLIDLLNNKVILKKNSLYCVGFLYNEQMALFPAFTKSDGKFKFSLEFSVPYIKNKDFLELPDWVDAEYSVLSWRNYYEYIKNIFNISNIDNNIDELIKIKYLELKFENYENINFNKKIFKELLAEELEFSDFDYEEENNNKVINVNFIAEMKGLRLNDEQAKILDKILNLQNDEVVAVNSPVGTLPSIIIYNYVACCFVKAILYKGNLPNIKLINKNSDAKKISILDCYLKNNIWLSKKDKSEFLCNQTDVIKKFLYNASEELGVVSNLSDAKIKIYSKLFDLYEIYKVGVNLHNNFEKIDCRLKENYEGFPGLLEKLRESKKNLKLNEAKNKHLELLLLMWKRKIANIPAWYKVAQNIPFLHKAYNNDFLGFFKSHFPEIKDNELNVQEMENYIESEIYKSKQKENSLSEKLKKEDLDMLQYKQAKADINNWNKNNLSLSEIRYKIFELAYHYYEAAFLQTAHMEDVVSDDYDIVFAISAEKTNLWNSIDILNKANKIISFADRDLVSENRIPGYIDLFLLEYFKLDGYEDDLLTKGMLALNGNLYNMTNYIASLENNTFKLEKIKGIAGDLINCRNELAFDSKLVLDKKSLNSSFDCNIKLINIVSKSEIVKGDRVNFSEVKAIENLLMSFSGKSLERNIVIYTTTKAQVDILNNIQVIKDNNIKVLLATKEIIQKKDIVLFSPVFTKEDKGPFCFDEGHKVMYQIVASAKKKLYITGDVNLFNKKEHSPTGKIASFISDRECEIA